jgi:hypothetical protein
MADACCLDLGCLPNLKMVHIMSQFQPDLASSVMSLLSSLHAPGLRQISFKFNVSGATVVEEIMWSKWLEVDDMLRGQAFSSICKLRVSLFATSVNEIRKVHQRFIENLPLLHSRQMLQIVSVAAKYFDTCGAADLYDSAVPPKS